MKKVNRTNKKLLQVLKFLVKFNLFSIPLYIILITGWHWIGLQQLTADLTMYILNFIGLNPTINDFIISIPIQHGTWAGFINFDCTGWKSMLAFFALIMSTPFSLRKKSIGMMLLPVIFAINLVRIAFMFSYVYLFDLAHYELVHAIIWSWGLILIVAGLWIFWAKADTSKLEKTIYSGSNK